MLFIYSFSVKENEIWSSISRGKGTLSCFAFAISFIWKEITHPEKLSNCFFYCHINYFWFEKLLVNIVFICNFIRFATVVVIEGRQIVLPLIYIKTNFKVFDDSITKLALESIYTLNLS